MGKQKGRSYTWLIVLVIILFCVILFFGFLGFMMSLIFNQDPIGTGNVAIIPVTGPIVTDADDSLFGASGYAISSRITKKIEKANDDYNIRAIIVEINSPGGSPVGSDEIAVAIENSDKPVVAVIREIGASGGYWVAAPADAIVAHRNSLVGSIGVVASYIEFPGLLERFNMSYNRLVAGKYKDAGSPFKEMTGEEQELFRVLLDELHDDFINHVATYRSLEYDYVKELATGWIYTGKQAQALGLVDELGGRDKAIEIIENDLNITAKTVEYKTQATFFDILTGTSQVSAYHVGRGIGDSFTAEQQLKITI